VSRVAPWEVDLPDAAWRRSFRGRLLRWYARYARDLPWRRSRDPYGVWLSEIMLQQTQVATVESYFKRFVAALPTIEALAAADEQDVLRLWEGLGYYRRARQLHKAAQIIAAQHGGKFPREVDDVHRLPGIGRYTAGAVLSIAFDRRLPILEANTTRLFARLLCYDGDPTSAAGTKLLWAMAEAALPRRDVGRFNQALMELGSEVCTSRGPRCERCPVAPLCLARAQGRTAEIPRKKAKPPIEAICEAAVVVRRRGRVLLMKCPDDGRWAGLWDFPRFAFDAEDTTAADHELVEGVRRLTGVEIVPGRRLTTIKHGVTRFRITLHCYEARCETGSATSGGRPTLRWLRPRELERYPLSTTGRKICRLFA